MSYSPLEKQLRRHVRTYQEYNSSTCAELDSTPSALEFHRFVASNRPVVIRGQGFRDDVPALDKWSDEYLIAKMEEKLVEISVDPTGRADSIQGSYFVEPANVNMKLSQLFDRLKEEEEEQNRKQPRPVYYLQSQSGNLTGEYSPLLDDVGSEGPSWAREAFGQSPDVANIWIGGNKSKTSIHKDPYENIYLVLRGSKEFILYPPSEAYCLHEQSYPHAKWEYDPSSSSSSSSNPFTLVPSSPLISIPWIPIDPLNNPSLEARVYPRYSLARPMKVTLRKGDVLYLPAFWFHHVSQSTDHHSNLDIPTREAGVKAAIAVNWWFDVKFDGNFWSGLELNRRLLRILDEKPATTWRSEDETSSDEFSEGYSEG
ncbi:hypothetical protein JCM3765_001434 [Sporobolomyces pararoseus]